MCGGAVNNVNNFYPENFAQQQHHRHQVNDGNDRGLFSSGYPVPTPSEPQHIRLQSPPHRLNNPNRNRHHNNNQPPYESAGTRVYCLQIIH